MRKSLRLSLAVSVALSVAALAWDEYSPQIAQSQVVERIQAPLDPRQTEVAPPASALASPKAPRMAKAWDPALLELASRDPFLPLTPPPPPEPKPVKPQVEAPPPPPPVPMTYRLLGRMSGPGGEPFVYLDDGDKPIPVKVGDRLPNGFVVDRVTEEAIHLIYPATQQRAVIPFPDAPS